MTRREEGGREKGGREKQEKKEKIDNFWVTTIILPPIYIQQPRRVEQVYSNSMLAYGNWQHVHVSRAH